MNVLFDSEKGELAFAVEHHELDEIATLMQLVFEEERRKGSAVPPLDQAFFEELTSEERNGRITFGFSSLPFARRILETLCDDFAQRGRNTAVIETFLCRIDKWLFDGHSGSCMLQ